jgi:hypothetical protein
MNETTASRRRQAATTPGPTICWTCEFFKEQTFGIMPEWGICLKFEETSFKGGGCYWGKQKVASGSRPRKSASPQSGRARRPPAPRP